MTHPMTPADFFSDHTLAHDLFALIRQLIEALGQSEMKVTRSQIAFSRRRGFAWVWMPEQYLKRPAAPLVLSISLPARDPSPRWKQIVEPAPGRFMHHLELYQPADLDAEVETWLRQAWEAAA